MIFKLFIRIVYEKYFVYLKITLIYVVHIWYNPLYNVYNVN